MICFHRKNFFKVRANETFTLKGVPDMLTWFLPTVGKWILWIGGGVMAIAGIFALNLLLVLLGVLIAVFGSVIALLLNLNEKNEALQTRLDFIIEKSGWKEDWEQEEIAPEEQEMLRRKEREQEKIRQEKKALVSAVRQKHPEELTPEQLGKLIEEERWGERKQPGGIKCLSCHTGAGFVHIFCKIGAHTAL